MTELDDLLACEFGVVRTAALRRAGLSKRRIDTLASERVLTSPAWGWYAGPEPDADAKAAVTMGGAVACVSALAKRGVWVPPDDGPFHIRLTQHHRSRRAEASTTCDPRGGYRPVESAVDSVRNALESAAGCLEPDLLVAVTDSALNRRLVTHPEVTSWFAAYPASIRDAVAACDARAESGTESLARIRIQRLGVRVRSQVGIDGVGRVDLLVGERLVVELDSIEHHANLGAYEKDRERDRRLRALGYIPIRLTYRQVMFEWEQVEADIRALLAAGEHRGPLRRPFAASA